MIWFKYDTIYVNGSSLTAGGGLGLKEIKKKYKELHNVEYDNEKDVTYGKYVADYFACNFINDAKSGSGSPRLVRKTLDYIKRVGIDKSRKTLFIFEIQNPTFRIELYFDKIKDYLTVNLSYDGDENEITSIQVQDVLTSDGTYYNHDFFKNEITEEVKKHLEKYHNPIPYFEKIKYELVGLFSFLEENKIDYFCAFDQLGLQDDFTYFYKKIKDKNIKIDNFRSVNDFCEYHGLSIKKELNNFTEDIHPGYFGNKLYGEKLIKFIEDKLKPKIFVFGDSFTQSFADHFESNNDWSTKYKNYKKYTPKNYADLLSDYFETESINYGKGGCSNYKIFDTFIEKFKSIKEQDIVIFNWTTETRFRISDDVNQFVDIIPFTPHPPQNKYVSKKSTEEIGGNRAMNNVWWKEVIGFIEVIKTLLPKTKILHWTWVDPKTSYQDDLWNKEMIDDNKNCIDIGDWRNVEDELKEIIKKCSDVIIDFSSQNLNYEQILKTLDENKRVTIINTNFAVQHREFITKNIRSKHLNTINYKKECYKNFISYKKYNTITDETNGEVEDLHYSEIGHKELFEDLIKEIEKLYNGNKKSIL
jgi:hypothetical protein